MCSLVMIFLIILTQLFGLAALADDVRDGIEALDRKDFNRALQLIRPLAESGMGLTIIVVTLNAWR